MSEKNANILCKMQELIDQIEIWNDAYYNQDKPLVSDQVYDSKYQELLKLESGYPSMIQPNSPTLKIGGIASNKFTKFKHQAPMLSLDKAYGEEDLLKFEKNIKNHLSTYEITLEPKIDGLSIALHYQGGELVRAVTRGDGVIGEDVTENVYMIASIPKRITYLNDLEVRGEVFMPKSAFETLNKNELEKNFANPRNAAAGTLRQLDKEAVRKRNLEAYFYFVVNPLSHDLKTQIDCIDFLNSQKIPTSPYFKTFSSVEKLKKEINHFEEVKHKFDFEIDGLVIKLNDITLWEELGYTAKFPKYAIAYKFENLGKTTKVLNIFPTVGRTGKITYVCQIEPIELNQTTVSNATLHNYDYIQNLNLNIGDEVYVVKAGEIIPKVLEMTQKNSQGTYQCASECPSCHYPLEYIDQNVDQYCLNENCSEKIIRQIMHFVSRDALNVMSLGEKIVRLFYEKGILRSIPDIFSLHKHREFILTLPSFKDKKVDKILNNIEASKETEISKVINGIGIKFIGERASKTISKVIKNLSELQSKTYEDLILLEDFGEKSAIEIIKFASEPKNKQLFSYLDEFFNYKTEKKTNLSGKFASKTFVITGTLSKSRDYFANIVELNGGIVTNSVSKKTSVLLYGAKAGSKLEKAQKISTIELWDEERFNKETS
ncbi:NAD-dependent DNA ligase LigA [Mycoplasma sp. Ms02]|uniref:NAD-dependent DNA ligase LigA n=1 Tax=Mycoplasma sp. Ms02 TaxID=353851 RepID=UPI001C8A22FB|nr:NAD-dependent DNA ligase LigA [Mycoplasma sp. Ms02]QZE12282.1 NAD-dependent DNA ligase LigA [Mycoplasma sp. Ms02]